jgi:hypothetical protein
LLFGILFAKYAAVPVLSIHFFNFRHDSGRGSNKFSKPGEKLWGLMLEATLIGIGGLNYDPYSEYPNPGRVRHLYIRKVHRRKGRTKNEGGCKKKYLQIGRD